ncbi:hypothetical protein PFISCL1PPCAC_28963, partial [Pristionchus fissidentatus]
ILFDSQVQCRYRYAENLWQLPCGNMIHESCINTNYNHFHTGIPCNFCRTDHKGVGKDDQPAKLYDAISHSMGNYFVCEARSKCDLHPIDNGIKRSDGKMVCVWCTLERRSINFADPTRTRKNHLVTSRRSPS